MPKQTVDQRMIRIPRSWMNNHAFGFIDDNHIVIFVHNIQFHFLRLRFQRFILRQRHIAGFDLIAVFYRQILDPHRFRIDQLLDAAARAIVHRLT